MVGASASSPFTSNRDRIDGRGPTAGDPSSARSLHRTTVVTPEAVVLDFATAGIGSRSLAVGIDLIIQGFALVAALFAAGMMALVSQSVAIVTTVITMFLVFFGYPALFEAFNNGQTPGKRALGLRVITTEGGPVGLRHSAIRALLTIFDIWFPAGGLVALTSALLTKRSQRVGDLAAGTVVVRRATSTETPVFFAPIGQAGWLVPLIDGGGIQPAEYAIVREFLLRAGELLPAARAGLARDLAERVQASVAAQLPQGVDPEQFLLAALVAHQQRFAHLGPVPGTLWTAPAPPSRFGAQPGPPGQPGARPLAADLAGLPPPPGQPVVIGR